MGGAMPERRDLLQEPCLHGRHRERADGQDSRRRCGGPRSGEGMAEGPSRPDRQVACGRHHLQGRTGRASRQGQPRSLILTSKTSKAGVSTPALSRFHPCQRFRNMKKPNILILMVDQLNGTFFPDGPAEFLHVPHLRKLAGRSTRFANCYTASPLCAPARASFMSGQLPFRTGVYDNAAEFSSEIPTYAHNLRNAGYQTALSGKMHFVGPDQLHGFEQRLTTDIYPADFGWTPDYRKPGERIDWWYHNLGSI